MNTFLQVLFISLITLFNTSIQEDGYPKVKPLMDKDLTIQIVPAEKKGKWGYADEKGHFRIKPVFDAVTEFQNDIARVKYNNKWGVIKKQFGYLFTPSFEEVSPFIFKGKEGYAFAVYDGKCGVIGSNREIIVPFLYDKISPTGVDEKAFYLRIHDKEKSVKKVGLVNVENGHVIIEPDIQDIDLQYYRDYSVIYVYKNGKTTLLNRDGKMLLGPYDNIWLFSSEAVPTKAFFCVIRERDAFAVVNSLADNSKVEFLYKDICYNPGSQRWLTNKHGEGRFPDSGMITCLGLAAEVIDKEVYCIYSHDGTLLPIRTDNIPLFNKNGNALFCDLNSEFYVLYDSSVYSFKEYNKMMSVDNYRRDNVLPEWARIYAPNRYQRSQITTSQDFLKGIKYESFSWSSNLFSSPLCGFGVKNEFGEWLLKPVLKDSDKRELWGWTVFPCERNSRVAVVSRNGRYGKVSASGEGLSMPLAFGSYEEAVSHWAERINDTGYYAIGSCDVDKEGYCKYGISDSEGNIVIPLKYDYYNLGSVDRPNHHNYMGGLFLVSIKDTANVLQYGVINLDDVLLTPLFKDSADAYDAMARLTVPLACVKLNGKWGYIDKTGKEVIPCRYDRAYDFSEGFARVKLNGKYGYIDKTGKEVVPCRYEDVKGFSKGLAWVKLNGKWGYVDKSGKEVIPFRYEDVKYFYEGLAFVKLNGKWGYIDKTGKEVIPFRYDDNYISYFDDGVALVELNGKYGLIDKTGKEVIPCRYDQAYRYSFEELMPVGLNGKYGYIDKTGREVIPCRYDYVDCFSEGLSLVQLNGKYVYIDKTGKEVLPCRYDRAYDFHEGLACVRLNGKWGYIDKTGKEVIPCRYDYVDSFINGLARVELNGEYGYIDKTGKGAYYFHEGLARVELNGKYGYIDETGKEVIPCRYEDVNGFSEGRAFVKLNGKWGLIDKAGKEVIPCRYDDYGLFR